MIGLYVTIIASVVYWVSWEIYYTNYGSDFTEQYMEYTKTTLVKEGKSEAEIEAVLAPQVKMFESYDNNIALRMALTIMEIFPVGLVISLISALIFGVFLKKKPEEVVAG